MSERNQVGPTTRRELLVANYRENISDERLALVLKGLHGRSLASQLVREDLESGKTLDEVFYTGEQHGFSLVVIKNSDDRFDITVGGHFGPLLGDSQSWYIKFYSETEFVATEGMFVIS